MPEQVQVQVGDLRRISARHDWSMQRVAVVGCIGSGKSTVARALGTTLGIPVFHLDSFWWQPGRYRITAPACRRRRHVSTPAATCVNAE